MRGLDAAIVQDFGVFSYLREHFPGLHLHASTQMTITGVEGAKLLKEAGAVRVVTPGSFPWRRSVPSGRHPYGN